MLTVFSRYFNVGAKVEIFSTAGPVLNIDNSNGLGLKIVWNVNKTNTSTSDSGSIQIYNLSLTNVGILENIQTLINAFKFSVRISFGWDNNVAELMVGQITKLKSKVITATDIITEIEFAENILNSRNADSLGLQIDEGLWLAAFEAMATQLGVTLSTQFKTALSNNPVALSLATVNAMFDSDPRKDMDVLVSSMGRNFTWSIQNGEIYLLNGGLFQDQTPPQILQPSSGLLEFTPQEDGGLAISALGHPGVRPGQQLLVYDGNNMQLGGGPLRIETVSWSGDTDTNCVMSIVARVPNPFV